MRPRRPSLVRSRSWTPRLSARPLGELLELDPQPDELLLVLLGHGHGPGVEVAGGIGEHRVDLEKKIRRRRCSGV
jgi:hypothetical protein